PKSVSSRSSGASRPARCARGPRASIARASATRARTARCPRTPVEMSRTPVAPNFASDFVQPIWHGACSTGRPCVATFPSVDPLVVPRRPPRPILFPSFEKVPEGKRHLELRTALYQILKLALADHATIGSDQFVYWNGREPKRCVAPDAFVRLGIPDHEFASW